MPAGSPFNALPRRPPAHCKGTVTCGTNYFLHAKKAFVGVQVLLRLQEAFYAGNISMTDEGMPDVPNSNTPSAALKAYLHLMPDGQACAPFTAPHVESIAIVGNGPLTAAHARAANQHDLVVR